MVYQENTHVIVMTTKEVERGRVRAAAKPQYHLQSRANLGGWRQTGSKAFRSERLGSWVGACVKM